MRVAGVCAVVQESCARAYRTHSSVHRALVVEGRERERKKGEREEDRKEKNLNI